ncbi:MAG TPA: fasciclin domain-containing protein, partial [Flavisolibacter sp.]|nr:fasciclin domain-containing protein [Flavisolibacter sp.]
LGTPQRIPMLNGKYQNLLNKTIDNANIVEADQQASNGVLQVIDKMLPVLSNGWDALQTNAAIPAAQKTYMLSLFRKVFDATNAVQIGVNPSTGEPVYQPGTDSIQTNLFWQNVYDLRNESGQYTLFVLTDAAWNSELNKFSPFCATVTNNTDSTKAFASWTVLKDLAVEGTYKATATTDTVLSRFNVKIPVDKASIVQTIKTSNGVIYIMNKVDVQPKDKIQPVLIQAENYSGTYVAAGAANDPIDRRSNTYFRDRFNPLTQANFTDVNIFNHGKAQLNILYRVRNVYSNVKYRAYWVALNDFNGGTTFSQKLAFGTPLANTFTLQNANGYTTVPANVYGEVLVGETTLPAYQPTLNVYLTSANSTTAAANPLVCDYIRLEPIF